MSRFDKVKKNQGALDAIDSYEADLDNKEEVKEEKKVKSDDEKRVVRSYSLTKKQLKLLQSKKLEEIDLSLSDIVGKAIEAYCQED